jgi:hypothetical protein
LLDTNDLLNTIKKAALEAVEAEKPVNLLFGKVTSASPLKINVEQKMILSSAQLVLTRNVTDYKVTMGVDFSTESTSLNADHSHDVSGDVKVDSSISPNDNNAKITNTVSSNISVQKQTINLSHSHKVKGNKTFTVYNGLVVGDEVVLLRMQGGQKYIVLDRVVS